MQNLKIIGFEIKLNAKLEVNRLRLEVQWIKAKFEIHSFKIK